MIEFVDRELSRAEIEARKEDVLSLLGEREDMQSQVDEHKREIKETKVDIARLDSRIWQLRGEIRSGKVREARDTQTSLEFEDVRHSDTLVERPVDPEFPVQYADADGNPLPDPREPPPEPAPERRPRKRRGTVQP